MVSQCELKILLLPVECLMSFLERQVREQSARIYVTIRAAEGNMGSHELMQETQPHKECQGKS